MLAQEPDPSCSIELVCKQDQVHQVPVANVAESIQRSMSEQISQALKLRTVVRDGLEFFDPVEVPEDLELNAFDLDNGKSYPELEGYTEGVPWTVDSGAAEPVANPKHFPDCQLEPSPGSQAGQTYVGP